ncbi:MAG: hypothetical protein KDA89_02365 [Planctomycetaceae bacterium]|nr:hypothetical protein [Planctomycetaceae bacterium]
MNPRTNTSGRYGTLSAVLLGISFLLTDTARAQQPDRPRLAVEFQGPVGKTRAISFLGDTQRLLAAGEGKVLELFDLQGDRVSLAGPGRWEFARGVRGEINDVVVTRDGKYAVIGGVSARGQRDVVIMDLATRDIVGALPNAAVGATDSDAHHFAAILSVAVSPDGKYAASASRNGEIRLWDLRQGFRRATGRLIRDRDLDPTGRLPHINSQFNPIAFPDNNTLLYTVMRAADRSVSDKPVRYDLTTGQATYMSQEFFGTGEVCAISASADGRTISIAHEKGIVHLQRQGVNGPSDAYSLSDGVLRNAVLSPDGTRLAVMGDTKDESRSFLAIIDTAAMGIIDRVEFPGKESCVTAAFSASGRQLAAHDDNSEVLLVWNLYDDTARPVAAPLQAEPLTIGGRGQSFRTGKFLRDKSSADTGYHLQLNTGNEVQQFSLTDGALIAPENSPLIGPDSFSGGWQVRYEDRHQTLDVVDTAVLISPQRTQHVLTSINPQQGEFTRVHCFIPGPDGRPAAIAFGTRIVDGIYVYPLSGIPAQLNNAQHLLRYFRDHNGGIVDLSVSADGRFLASVSKDKTVKIWSLAELFSSGKRSIYGAEVITDNAGTVRLQNVLNQGIFFGRRLRNGDRIIRFDDSTGRLPPGGLTNSADIKRALDTQSPFVETYLWTERLGNRFTAGGDDDRVILVPGWEPLMTLVVDKTREWVVFTPEGYYNASAAEGHRLFGWQFNRGRDQTPQFEPAAALQKVFERPSIIRDVLRFGNVADAVAAAGLPIPDDFQTALAGHLDSLPQIRITSPADNSTVPGNQPYTLQADVRFPPGTDPDRFELRADSGGRTLTGETRVVRNGVATVQWQVPPLDDLNRVRVSAVERNGSLLQSLATDRLVTIRSQKPQQTSQPHLYIIAAASEDYEHEPKLASAIDDAEGVYDSLKNHHDADKEFAYRRFSDLSVIRSNAEVKREQVQADVARVMKEVERRKNPEDLILMYVTGHGVVHGATTDNPGTFYYLPPHVNHNNVEQLQQEALDWTALTDQVNRAACHVVWAIDACHSGAAAEAAKSMARLSSGTGRRDVLLSTSEAGELALENQYARVRDTDAEEGHGWFSAAFMETLVDNDFLEEVSEKSGKLRADGVLTTEEIGEYIAARVRDATGNNQRPVYTPKLIAPSSGLPINLLQRAE